MDQSSGRPVGAALDPAAELPLFGSDVFEGCINCAKAGLSNLMYSEIVNTV
jgi:hypothetical protein